MLIPTRTLGNVNLLPGWATLLLGKSQVTPKLQWWGGLPWTGKGIVGVQACACSWETLWEAAGIQHGVEPPQSQTAPGGGPGYSRAVKGLVVLEPEQQPERRGGGEGEQCFRALVSKTRRKQLPPPLLYLCPGSQFPRRWLRGAVTSAG